MKEKRIEKHMKKQLSWNDPSFVFTMEKKETVNIDIVIDSSKSFSPNIQIFLKAQGAAAIIRCIVLPEKGAVISLTTTQMHEAPHTKSILMVKTVVKEKSTFVFNGNIHIAPAARKSDAYQKNVNLLVGDGGTVITSPTLEILNNDVLCTHGATTGTIPCDAVWYMKTRGIGEKAANKLYIEGFIRDTMVAKVENL